MAAASLLPLRQWLNWPASTTSPLSPHEIQAARDAETIWKNAGNPGTRHQVDVLRTIDGDTFEARVHLSPGVEPTTRVRLRGVDAPELKAACPGELELAEAAGAALRGLLGEGGVTIYNIGPDKYGGRVVADAATRRTDMLRRHCSPLVMRAVMSAAAAAPGAEDDKISTLSFRDGPKDQTRNLEIPGSSLRDAPE